MLKTYIETVSELESPEGAEFGRARQHIENLRTVCEQLRLALEHSNGRRAMTLSQLVRALAQATGSNAKTIRSFLDALAQTAVTETEKSGVFVLPGIGRLVRVDRKARMGRNPATGEAIKIPSKRIVKFRVAKAVKDAVVPSRKK